jgi:cystathionine beta-lyase
MSRDRYKPSTRAGHLGRAPEKVPGRGQHARLPRVDDALPTVEKLEQAARGEYDGIGYGLHGLPTVTDLQDAVAAVEGAHAALAVPSGLTATTLPLLAL